MNNNPITKRHAAPPEISDKVFISTQRELKEALEVEPSIFSSRRYTGYI